AGFAACGAAWVSPTPAPTISAATATIRIDRIASLLLADDSWRRLGSARANVGPGSRGAYSSTNRVLIPASKRGILTGRLVGQERLRDVRREVRMPCARHDAPGDVREAELLQRLFDRVGLPDDARLLPEDFEIEVVLLAGEEHHLRPAAGDRLGSLQAEPAEVRAAADGERERLGVLQRPPVTEVAAARE